MNPALKGYPGLRRNPVTAALDLQSVSVGTSQSRPVALTTAQQWAVANDNALGTISTKGTGSFLRDERVRTFGKKAVRRFVTPKLPIMKLVDTVQTVVEFYQLVKSPGNPLPRDPGNAEDMELEFPSNWTPTDHNFVPNFTATHGMPPNLSGAPTRWFAGFGGGWNKESWFTDNRHEWPIDTVISAGPSPITAYDEFTGFYPDGMPGLGSGTSWVKDAPGPNPTYRNPPRTSPPEVVTIPLPGGAPAPRPSWRDLPGQPRHPDSEVGPRPVPRPPAPMVGGLPVPPPITLWPPPEPLPGVPAPAPAPGRSPVADPRAGDYPNPYGQPSPSPAPRPQPRRPPEAGVKERKAEIKRGAIAQAINGAVGGVTESIDAIVAIWKALPPEFKTGYYKLHYKDKTTGKLNVYYKRRFMPTIVQMTKDIYKGFGSIDLKEALMNVVEMTQEDRLYGELGKRMGQAGAGAKLNRGMGVGPWDTANSELAMKEQMLQRQKKNQLEKAKRLKKKEERRRKAIIHKKRKERP